MQDTPDISKIISLIMQNPSLIEQISALAKSGTATEAETVAEAESEPESIAEPTVSAISEAPVHSRAKRKELLNAMKPYLSEGRRTAIDSMSSILDILEVMKRKES